MDNALKSFESKNVKASVNELKALVNQMQAQRGKSLTDEQADSIIKEIEKVILIINS